MTAIEQARKMPPTNATLNKTAILAIILLSYVMIVLDTSIVLTGLPNIHRELGFSDAELAWVQSAYTLTFGGFLLLGARAGDILGRRMPPRRSPSPRVFPGRATLKHRPQNLDQRK